MRDVTMTFTVTYHVYVIGTEHLSFGRIAETD